jgi:hypothetical protein
VIVMKSIKRIRFVLLPFLLSALAAEADEASWDFSANLELQSRLFTQDARWPGQESQTGQLSIATTAELRWRNGEGDQRASFIPFLRWDQADDERSLIDLREAYWAYEADSLDLLIGSNTVFWGVTESVHLVDIINQTDAVADIDGEDKLGQPMVNLALQRDWGLVSLYVLPYFRERKFAGPDGRFRAPLPVDLQYTRDAWLWKLEAIVRDGFADTFAAAVGGFEYTFYQVGDSAADVGVLLEYQYDGRGVQEAVTIADNDVFAAARLALNDTQDTAVLAGVGYDVDTSETFINIEADRRIGENYVIELRARVFAGARPGDLMYTLINDDYVQLQLSRYF